MSLPLEASDEIGRGTRRVCYAHPENPDQCIKIPITGRLGRVQQRRETRYYRQLTRRGCSFAHLPRYYGIARTNLGVGYVYELIRDADGRLSNSLRHHLNADRSMESRFGERIARLREYLLREKILIYDFNGGNVLWQVQGPHDGRLVLIDGVGDTVAIPVLNAFASHVRSKITRRMDRQMAPLLKRHPNLAVGHVATA